LRYFLAISVAEYDDPSIPDLPGVRTDTRRLCDVIRSCADGGVHDYTFLDDGNARKHHIVEKLKAIARSAPHTAQVIIYFGGHGYRFRDKSGKHWKYSFLPYDAWTTDRHTQLSTDEIRKILASCRAREIVLIFDCCYSGGIAVEVTSHLRDDISRGDRSLLAIGACRGDEEAAEDDAGGFFLPDLCDALEGHGVIPDSKGRISVQAAFAAASVTSSSRATARGHTQLVVQSGTSTPIYIARVRPTDDAEAAIRRLREEMLAATTRSELQNILWRLEELPKPLPPSGKALEQDLLRALEYHPSARQYHAPERLARDPRRAPRFSAFPGYSVLTTVAILALLIGGWAFYWRLSQRATLNLASTQVADTWHPIVALPWVDYASDFGDISQWNTRGIADKQDRVDQWLGRLRADGVRGVVWFLLGDGRSALDVDKSGSLTGLKPSFWDNFERAAALLEKHDLDVIWVIFDYTLGFPRDEQNGVPIFGRADLIEDERQRRAVLDRVIRPLAERGARHDHIAGWVLFNEPEHMLRKGYVTRAAVESFMSEGIDIFRAAAPRQPIGIGNSDLASMLFLAPHAQPDFFMLHHYKQTPPPPALLVESFLTPGAIAKPIFLAEFNLNYPPGGDASRFINWGRQAGYAAVWPWSVRNRATSTGEHGEDIEPQFDLVAEYARAIDDARRIAERSPDGMREWKEAAPQALAELRAQLAQAERDRRDHETNLRENRRWLAEIDTRLREKDQERPPVEADFIRAQVDVKRNDDWVNEVQKRLNSLQEQRAAAAAAGNTAQIKHVLELIGKEREEAKKATSALQQSSAWFRDKQKHLAEIDGVLVESKQNHPEALMRFRMHDYLLAETTNAADVFRKLIAALGGGDAAPAVRYASFNGKNLLVECRSKSTPCGGSLMSASLHLELDKIGYAAVYVIDRFAARFPQGWIVKESAASVPISFGGRGDFIVEVRTGDRPLDMESPGPELPGVEQLRAYFKVP
jgi:hypothetical protein